MSWRDDVAAQVRDTTATGYVRAYCPACPTRVGKTDRSKAISVSMSTGWWKCHRCDWRGRLDGYSDDQGQLFGDPEHQAAPLEVEQPSSYEPIIPGSLVTGHAARYLLSRGVPQEAWERFQLGYAADGDHAGRIILPLVHTDDWEHVGWVGRLARTPKPWERAYHTAAGVHRAHAFWNADALGAPGDMLLVTEGVFDAIPLYPHAVACLGKPTNDQLATLASCAKPLVMVLDADAWTTGLARTIQLRAAGLPAWCLALPHARDPGTSDPTQILDAARYAVEHRADLDLT